MIALDARLFAVYQVPKLSLSIQGQFSHRDVIEHILWLISCSWLGLEPLFFGLRLISDMNILDTILSIHVHVPEVYILRSSEFLGGPAIVPVELRKRPLRLYRPLRQLSIQTWSH